MNSILIPTPVGVVHATAGSGALLGVTLLLSAEGVAENPSGLLRDLGQRVNRYFEGQPESFVGVPLEPSDHDPPVAALYQAVREIPHGQTRSYAQMGQLCGLAPRAVSEALIACPFFLVVPAHRVIQSDGALGGLVGREGVKEWLLKHEGAWPL